MMRLWIVTSRAEDAIGVARMLYRKGEFRDAALAYPNVSDYYYVILIKLCLLTNDKMMIEETIDRLIEHHLSVGNWEDPAAILFDLKLFEPFDKYLDEIDELDFALVRYAEAGEYAQCEKIMRRMAEIDSPNSDKWLKHIAEMYEKLEMLEDAERVLRELRAVEQDPPVAKSKNAHKVCPSCDNHNEETAQFCIGCGQSLSPEIKNCPQCNEKNDAEANFCKRRSRGPA